MAQYPIYTPFKHMWYHYAWITPLFALITIAIFVLIYYTVRKNKSIVNDFLGTAEAVETEGLSKILKPVVKYGSCLFALCGPVVLWYIFYEWVIADQP